jgi:long-subunit fatty acid transport protein
MKKSLLIVLLLISSLSFAQRGNSSSFDWKNVSYGGRLNLDLSTNVTSIILAPTAIYKINEQFSAGASISFGYTKFKDFDIKWYNYGASVLGCYKPIDQLELSAEIEQTFINERGGFDNVNTDYLSFYLGAGYRVKNFVIGMRYDLLFDEDTSLYASPFAPFVRVYF